MRIEVCTPTTAAAYFVCALGSYDDIRAMLDGTDGTGTAALLLAATAWQCEGDALRAEAVLRRAAESAPERDRPYVIDVLVPLLISRGVCQRAASVLATDRSPVLELGRTALQAVIDASNGAYELSASRAEAIREALPHLDDDVLRLRIHQRLALAAYYRSDADEALEAVAQGLRLARLLSAHRFACTLHSVAYTTHYACTGDAEMTWYHATELVREAELGGDASYRAIGRVAVYELAAERGDEGLLEAARAALQRDTLPEQYRERFARGIADVLRLLWCGDFTTSRNVLAVLKDITGRTDGERALCRALLALTSIALDDDDNARRLSRQAISTSARPEKRIAAHELRYRQVARALAAVAGQFAGDVVRGRRAAEARFLHGAPDVAGLLKFASAALPLADVPKTVRGYARVLAIVKERVEARPAKGPLTNTEVDVLRLISAGRTAPQIATLLDRSPHTVRTHLRNISVKLDARGRIETLARARHLGVL
ncbi:MAG TPA: LuxR C-terminal-related transcriptional regulator [Candidatus Elarobacter sp.]|jgi:DNA-binding CsgD family transcriptional regulator|nr:LuxR C-terminal-related transcriptional regulator [Candidatus Elarobacter sp.]